MHVLDKIIDLLDCFPVVLQTLYHEHPEPLWLGFSRFHLMSMLPKTEDFSFLKPICHVKILCMHNWLSVIPLG